MSLYRVLLVLGRVLRTSMMHRVPLDFHFITKILGSAASIIANDLQFYDKSQLIRIFSDLSYQRINNSAFSAQFQVNILKIFTV